jgi:hypothetical protein
LFLLVTISVLIAKDGNEPALAIGLSSIFTLVVMIGTFIARMVGRKGPVAKFLEELNSNYVSQQRIEGAVRDILPGITSDSPFRQWVEVFAAQALNSLNDWPHASHTQRVAIIAEGFSRLGTATIRSVLPGLPVDVAEQRYAVKTVAKRLLQQSDVININGEVSHE